MTEIFCGTQILASDSTETYMKDRINHNGNGNTFILLSIEFKRNLIPSLIKQNQMTELILAKRWKLTLGIHFITNICSTEQQITKDFLANINVLILQMKIHLWPHITRGLGIKLNPWLRPGFIPYGVLWKKDQQHSLHITTSSLFSLHFLPFLPFYSFLILPPMYQVF